MLSSTPDDLTILSVPADFQRVSRFRLSLFLLRSDFVTSTTGLSFYRPVVLESVLVVVERHLWGYGDRVVQSFSALFPLQHVRTDLALAEQDQPP